MKMIGRLGTLILIAVLSVPAAAAAVDMASIVDNDINMRSGPGMQHAVIWKLDAGFPVEILSTRGEWVQVRDFEGASGWVHNKKIDRTPHMIVKANRGTSQQINVRSEPNINAAVVATARYGVVFKTLTTQDGWVQVLHEKGTTGWVDGRLLWGF
ncbi:SH3 domain-containing protein [Desulfobulbus oligotrophicus]|jgi:SH3-like domain-containing protein|nr:SH3 domain-containing protein [Desulfobulbus oligotrophicus]MDY0390785.1 SH3 domain-containing protein [Desulfobulbus oligotrophicus]